METIVGEYKPYPGLNAVGTSAGGNVSVTVTVSEVTLPR